MKNKKVLCKIAAIFIFCAISTTAIYSSVINPSQIRDVINNGWNNTWRNLEQSEYIENMRSIDKQRSTYKEQSDNYYHQIDELDKQIENYYHQIDESKKQKENYNKQISDLDLQLCYLNYQEDTYRIYNIYTEKNDIKRRESTAFEVQQEYYKSILYSCQIKLLEKKLEVLEAQKIVEQQKVQMQLSTETAVIIIDNQIEICKNDIASLELSISLSKAIIENIFITNKISESHISLVYDIPEYINDDVTGTSLSILTALFLKNSVDVALENELISSMNNYLSNLLRIISSTDPTYSTNEVALEKQNMQKVNNESTYKLNIIAIYNSYLNAKNVFTIASNALSLLESQKTVIDKAYELGNISYVDYLIQTYEIESQQYSTNEAKVKYLIAIEQVTLISRGIMPSE